MTDPRSLHEVRRLSAFARSLPGVTQVQHIVQPLAMVGDSMAGLRGLPQNSQQVVALLFFLEGEPSLRTMLSPDRKSVLVHVRVLGDAAQVVSELRRYVTNRLPRSPQRQSLAELSDELSWLLPPAVRNERTLKRFHRRWRNWKKPGLHLRAQRTDKPEKSASRRREYRW